MIKCCSGFEFQISVTNGEFNSYDMDYYGPEDLIKIIKYYYKQGVLKEDLNALNEMLLEDQIDMNDITELQRRKIMLLGNNNLNDLVNKMIKTKGLPAELDSITLIAGRDGKTEIVARLYINVLDADKTAKVYLYITEYIFDLENSFEYVDRKIGPRAKSLSDDDLIKLRALRVIYDAIKNVSSGYVKAGDQSDAIYIRTSKTGGLMTR